MQLGHAGQATTQLEKAEKTIWKEKNICDFFNFLSSVNCSTA